MANRKLPILVGSVVAVVGAVVAVGGGALLAVVGSDSEFTTGREHVTTATTALVTPIDDINGINGFTSLLGRPELRLNVSGGDKQVFIGIGRTDAVDKYLAGANIDKVKDFDLDPFTIDRDHRAGTAQPAAPAAQKFWVAKAAGTKPTLDWKVRDGNYRFVIMNADATPDVALDGRFTLAVPRLWALALGALVAGLVGTGVGLMMIVIGGRRPRDPYPDKPVLQPATTDA